MKNKVSPKCKIIIWVIFISFLIISVLNCIQNSLRENNLEKQSINNYDFYNEVEKIFFNYYKEEKTHFFSIFVNLCLRVSIIIIIISIFLYFIINALFFNEELEDERIEKIVNQCKEKLGIKRKIRLIYQDLQDSPSIIGVFNVKILFSEVVFFLDDRELECIIMHELSHYKRKDNKMSFMINYLKIVYLFNPFIGKILGCMRMDIETATDRLAIKNLKDIEDTEYCDVLEKMKVLCNKKGKYGLNLVSKESEVSYRINAIKNKKQSKKYKFFTVISTSTMVLFMIFMMYPVSYGNFEIPKLYLKLDDGSVIDIEKENNIRLSSGTSISISADNDKNIESIFFEKNRLNVEQYCFSCIKLDRKIYYESGEYICKITVNCKNRESINYEFNVLME